MLSNLQFLGSDDADGLEGKELKPGVKGEGCCIFSLLFLMLVNLYHNERLFASGEIVKNAEKVHNIELKQSEVKVLVNSIAASGGEVTHPLYGYDIERGSYVAWSVCDLKCDQSINIG